MDTPVTYHLENRIAYLTLSRPEKRNALNASMVQHLQQLLEQCREDAGVKIVVIRAEGKVFCSGADLESLMQLQSNTYEENLEDSQLLKRLFETIYTFPKLTIAQVQGHALAGGCGLMTVCDLAYAVPEAKLGYTEVRIGFVPALVLVFLRRKVGEAYARKLLLTGDLISAEMGERMGLVHQLVEADRLESTVRAEAERLASQNSSMAIALTKELLNESADLALVEGLNLAAETNAKARGTEDCKQGIAAFLEKKKLEW